MKNLVDKCFEVSDEKFSIAGGSVLTLLMFESPFLIKDIDIFPNSIEDYEKIKLKLDQKLKKDKVNVTENKNSRSYRFKEITIDLIKKFYKNTEDCLSSFDLSVVKFGFNQNYDFFSLTKLSSIFNFEMRVFYFDKPDKAFSRLRRIIKYSQKGFKIRSIDLIDIYSIIKSNENKFLVESKEDNKESSFLFDTGQTLNPNFLKVKEETILESEESYHTLVD